MVAAPAMIAPSMILASLLLVGQVTTPPIPRGIAVDGKPFSAEAPIPLPSPDLRWQRLRTKHFTIISSATEARTREIAENLETLAAALRKLHPRFERLPTSTLIYLFSRRSESQPYFDLLMKRRKSISNGVFVAEPDGSGTMIIDTAGAWRSDRTPYHELIHSLLANQPNRLPLWLEEGLADYFSSAEVRGRTVRVGASIRAHVVTMRRRSLIPLPEIFAIQRDSDASAASLFYAESWGVVDWMMRHRPHAFDPFVTDIINGVNTEVAILRHYGVKPAIIARALSTRTQIPARTLSLPAQDVGDVADIEPLSPSDVLCALGGFLSKLTVTHDDAARHFDRALALEPNHGLCLAAYGILQARKRDYLKSEEFFEKAIAAAPDDAEIALSYAEALLRNTLGPFSGTTEVEEDAPERFRKARELAARALAANYDRPRALGNLGSTYLVESDVRDGLRALDEATTLLPGRVDFAINRLALLERIGDRATSQSLQDQLMKRNEPQIVLAVKAVVVRERLGHANRLIASNREAEAIPLIRELIDLTPDDAGKQHLETQLRDVEKVARENAQIVKYNEAVAAVNRGDRDAALRISETLLQTATDPEIVKLATALRERLRGTAR